MITQTLKRFLLLGMMALLFLSAETCAFTTKPTTITIQRMMMTSKNLQRSTRFHMASSDGGPAVLDKPETIEKVDEAVKSKDEEQVGSDGWEIRLFNDPFNKREFVARCLATICGKTDSESYQIMMQAHNNGMGVVGRYMYEIAELYYKSLQENGLLVDMVRVDDD
mmetsp:Transcript_24085/g.36594  ORF Transcript_24085/g.36594 Transcript_24085/m.36594 type:complete len:166 (+) Transcript_24085:184-681(+)